MQVTPFQQRLAQQQALINQAQQSVPPPDQNTQQDPASDPTSQQDMNNLQGVGNALQTYQQAMNPQTILGNSGRSFGPPPAGMSHSQWAGLCEAWAEQQTFGHQGVFPTAIAGAQHFAQTGQLNPDITKAPKGALIYFYDPNQPDGHVGIASGDGRTFTSATYNGVQTNPLQAWQQSTGQRALGFVVPK